MLVSSSFLLSTVLLLSYFVIEETECMDDEAKCQEIIAKSRKKDKNSIVEREVMEWHTPWTYKCVSDACERTVLPENEVATSLEVCWLNCGENAALWPYPTIKTHIGKSLVPFQYSNLNFKFSTMSSEDSNLLLKNGIKVFKERFQKMKESGESSLENPLLEKSGKENIVNVHLFSKTDNVDINLATNESYYLEITKGGTKESDSPENEINVVIKAATYFGVRHGLETLTQLIAFDIYNNCFQIVSSVEIEDEPAFPYRGLLIDTGRNFIPIESLKRMVDGMSYNKFNVLHWHITDSNSFPFYTESIPQMTKYGAYGASKIYYPGEVAEFVNYARVRGIKVLPELDLPAHAGAGWDWGPEEGYGEMALCINKQPWRTYCGQPPCGQLNPANPNVLKVLGLIFKDFLSVFDSDIFHLGGDEVVFRCWKGEPDIAKFMLTNKLADHQELWAFFTKQAYDKLKESNNNKPIHPIIWTSGLTGGYYATNYLNTSEFIIQVWEGGTSDHVRKLVRENYRLIFSNVDKLYLDQGFGTWLGRDHNWEYKVWQNMYDNNLKTLTRDATKGQILGGEATLWSEKVNQYNMDMKLWPRGSALAENLWSSPDFRADNVLARLIHQNNRMIQMGIYSDQLQPESCHQQTKGFCEETHRHLRI